MENRGTLDRFWAILYNIYYSFALVVCDGVTLSVASNRQQRYRKASKKMAFIPVPATAKVTWHFDLFGQKAEFGIYLKRLTGSIDVTDLQNLAGAARDWWSATQAANHTQYMSLVRTNATDYSTQGAPSIDNIPATPIPGAQGSFVPNGAANVITLRTAKRGRKYRGRMYLPGIAPASGWTGNNITNGQVADLLADAAAMITALEAVSSNAFDAVVVSRYTNKFPLQTATTEPVTVASMDSNWDSQRRRNAGRGI